MTGDSLPDRLLSPKEAADFLGVSSRHLADLARAGEVPSVPLGRLRRFDPESLRQWVADHRRTR